MNLINYKLFTNELPAIFVFGFILGKYIIWVNTLSVTEIKNTSITYFITYSFWCLFSVLCYKHKKGSMDRSLGLRETCALLALIKSKSVKLHCGKEKGGSWMF